LQQVFFWYNDDGCGKEIEKELGRLVGQKMTYRKNNVGKKELDRLQRTLGLASNEKKELCRTRAFYCYYSEQIIKCKIYFTYSTMVAWHNGNAFWFSLWSPCLDGLVAMVCFAPNDRD